MRLITRVIWILSLVSLLTDMASEMLYPIMPVYLESIHFSIFAIGLLEGCAEAVAGLSKGYFGQLSDRTGRRMPFVQLGYFLSALSKPMMALFTAPLWVFGARTTDRLGKGIRTGARDALLSAEATAATKGAVFGFHRGMDTAGAVLGPLAALIYLYYYPQDYRSLFFIAFVPGLGAILLTGLIKEKKTSDRSARKSTSFFSFLRYWKTGPPAYRRVVAGLLLFAIVNSSDVFLLLKIKGAGYSDTMMIGTYIFYNLVYAAFAFPIGKLADKAGLRRTFIAGLVLFFMVYMGMAAAQNIYVYLGLFFVYGIYAAATEGVAKAWISNIAAAEDTATAIGTYTGLQSICALLASSIIGLVWLRGGSTLAFCIPAIGSAGVILYFLVNTKQQAASNKNG